MAYIIRHVYQKLDNGDVLLASGEELIVLAGTGKPPTGTTLKDKQAEEFRNALDDIHELWKEYANRPFGGWECQEEHVDALVDKFLQQS